MNLKGTTMEHFVAMHGDAANMQPIRPAAVPDASKAQSVNIMKQLSAFESDVVGGSLATYSRAKKPDLVGVTL